MFFVESSIKYYGLLRRPFYYIFSFMISRLWQSISSLFGTRKQQPPVIVKRAQRKQRFIVIQDPFQRTQIQKSKSDMQSQLPKPKNSEQLLNIYKLTQGLPNEASQKISQQQTSQTNKFFLDMSSLSQTLKEIEQKEDKILSNNEGLMQDLTTILTRIVQVKQCQNEERVLYRNYVKNILNVVQFKYTGEKIDFPHIQYQKYRQVVQVWDKGLKKAYANMTVPGYDHLKFVHLRLLAPKQWLNDEIVSQYTNLMNLKLAENPNNKYHILNSLKVSTLFEKPDYQKLSKILSRSKISPQSTIILCIHKVNHWLFIKMQQQSILIYDSLPLSTLNSYTNFPLIGKIIKFSQFYYGDVPQIERVLDFPTQSNGYDCGMMMMCGIRDVVRERRWGFSQADIVYKRVLITKQLLEKKITGFSISD